MQALLARVPGPDKINNFRMGDSQPGRLLNTAGYSFLAGSNQDLDNVTGKLDYNLSIKHALAATFVWNRDLADRPDELDASDGSTGGYYPTPPVTNHVHPKLLALSWRWSPVATFTNELRGGLNFAPLSFDTSEQIPPYIIAGPNNNGGTIYTSPIGGFLPQGREFAISMPILFEKSGAEGTYRRFKFEILRIIQRNDLPGFSLSVRSESEGEPLVHMVKREYAGASLPLL